MNRLNYRIVQYALLLVTLLVLLFSFYFQYVKDLEPCPLCMMQRLSVMLILPCLVMTSYLGLTAKVRKYLILQMVFSVAGFYFAGRQIWLQMLPPDQVGACMPGLDVMMQYFPWQDIARALFLGSGDCVDVSWRFLGLTMPAWTAMYFFGMLIAQSFSYVWVTRVIRRAGTI